MSRAEFPQFVHVTSTIMVTNVNRPRHPWTVQYQVSAFLVFAEKHERHFETKKEAMEFARSLKEKAR